MEYFYNYYLLALQGIFIRYIKRLFIVCSVIYLKMLVMLYQLLLPVCSSLPPSNEADEVDPGLR